ncbi:hypothetical protein [Symmachiella dynata]|uniref:hypothetical protein n=1 Tax=Symmachiella dynata TaxID=2527995 RepID=UPI0030EE3EC7|tara:strand:+ start:1443 stop:1883 length:441 start_codon:yes stop_codon:yes gene_type:complete
MMKWLQSSDLFNDVAEWDERTGVWRVRSKSSEGGEIPSEIDGFYSILSGVFCAIYRSNGELVVRIGEAQIKFSNKVEITVGGPPEKRCLSLMENGIERVKHEYAVNSEPIENDPTPFVEDEDFDFGLFLSNIAHDPNRQARFKREL